jgi:hypothetical protein
LRKTKGDDHRRAPLRFFLAAVLADLLPDFFAAFFADCFIQS